MDTKTGYTDFNALDYATPRGTEERSDGPRRAKRTERGGLPPTRRLPCTGTIEGGEPIVNAGRYGGEPRRAIRTPGRVRKTPPYPKLSVTFLFGGIEYSISNILASPPGYVRKNPQSREETIRAPKSPISSQ